MLTIRDAQMTILGDRLRAAFEHHMLRRIQTEFPERFREMGEAGARAFLRRVLAAGARYDIDTRGALVVLVELMLEFGEAFERAPERRRLFQILEHRALPGPVKVDAVRQRIHRHTDGRPLILFRPVGS